MAKDVSLKSEEQQSNLQVYAHGCYNTLII